MPSPLISIIIPSFNQAGYLEQALDSIRAQDYPRREVLVIDGGSTDGTVDVLKKRGSEITWWCSEPDRGQTHAINKGLARMTGEVWMYLNSDDLLSPGTLRAVAEAWDGDTDWVWGDALKFDAVGEHGLIRPAPVARPIDYLAPWNRAQPYVIPCSCACFLSRRLTDICGPLDESLHYGMDKDYYVRALLRHGFKPKTLSRVLAKWRLHPGSKTMLRGVSHGFLEDQIRIAETYADTLPPEQTAELLAQLPEQRVLLAHRRNAFARDQRDVAAAWTSLLAIPRLDVRELLRRRFCSAALRTLLLPALPPLRRLRSSGAPVFPALLALRTRIVRRLNPPKRDRLLMPPAAVGSIGDEAMVESWLHALAGENIGVVAGGFPAEARLAADRLHPDLEHLLSTGRLQSCRDFARILADYRAVDFIGADVLDGHYSSARTHRRLRLIAFAAACGAETTVLGCSLNARPEATSAALWARLPRSVRVCARDPLSRRRLEETAGRPIDATADIAFLLPPAERLSPDAVVTEKWIRDERAADRRIVGLNLNPAVAPGRGDDMAVTLGRALCSLAATRGPLSVLLIPHDQRPAADDRRLLGVAREQLQAAGVSLHALALPCGAGEIKRLVGGLDAVITSRMHLGIACLGMGVPVAAFEYQDKFSGLFALFGLPECVLPAALATDEPGVTGTLSAWLERLPALSETIRARLPEITRMARLNLQSR